MGSKGVLRPSHLCSGTTTSLGSLVPSSSVPSEKLTWWVLTVAPALLFAQVFLPPDSHGSLPHLQSPSVTFKCHLALRPALTVLFIIVIGTSHWSCSGLMFLFFSPQQLSTVLFILSPLPLECE